MSKPQISSKFLVNEAVQNARFPKISVDVKELDQAVEIAVTDELPLENNETSASSSSSPSSSPSSNRKPKPPRHTYHLNMKEVDQAVETAVTDEFPLESEKTKKQKKKNKASRQSKQPNPPASAPVSDASTIATSIPSASFPPMNFHEIDRAVEAAVTDEQPLEDDDDASSTQTKTQSSSNAPSSLNGCWYSSFTSVMCRLDNKGKEVCENVQRLFRQCPNRPQEELIHDPKDYSKAEWKPRAFTAEEKARREHFERDMAHMHSIQSRWFGGHHARPWSHHSPDDLLHEDASGALRPSRSHWADNFHRTSAYYRPSPPSTN